MQDLRSYEAAVVLRADLSDEQIEAYIARLQGIVTGRGGELGDPDRWGRRRLAYEIERQRDGYYVILPFKAPPDAPEELRRVMRLSEEVLRFMVVHPPKPSKGQSGKPGRPGPEGESAPHEVGAAAPHGAPAQGHAMESPSVPAVPPASTDAAEAGADKAVPTSTETSAPTPAVLTGADREIPD